MSINTLTFLFNFREVASNNETMATILLQNLLIQLDEQLGRVSKEKNLLLIHNLKRIRKVLQVRMHFYFSKKGMCKSSIWDKTCICTLKLLSKDLKVK